MKAKINNQDFTTICLILIDIFLLLDFNFVFFLNLERRKVTLQPDRLVYYPIGAIDRRRPQIQYLTYWSYGKYLDTSYLFQTIYRIDLVNCNNYNFL